MLLDTVFVSKLGSSDRRNYPMMIPSLLLQSYDLEELVPAHCQRELCWSEEQYESYVKHVLCEKDCGSFIFYRTESEYKLYVLDGQHRLEALRRFIDKGMSVKHLGKTYTYNDFCAVDKRSFRSILGNVTMIDTDEYSKEYVEGVYKAFNYSGAKHV